MLKSIYLASRFENQKNLRHMREVLIENGFDVTARWLDVNTRPIPDESSDKWESHARQWSQTDLTDVSRADVLVLDLTCSLEGMRGGLYVELGIALALGKKIIIVGSRPNVFCFHSKVERVYNWGDCLEALRVWRRSLSAPQPESFAEAV
jgi:nucleoside 2-deoxyribosyltransferase